MSRRNTGGRVRAIFFLVVSFGAAAVACIVIYFVLASYRQELIEAEQEEQTVAVMVAAHDLYQGITIVEEDLEMAQLPPDYVPPNVKRNREQAVGRVPRERILRREFIRDERLADPEAGIGLNAIIPRGMRALSINISDGSAVSGFLNPGNYVDILVTLRAEGEDLSETVTLLQAVPVLAVNSRVGKSNVATDNARPSITVAVTPEQAERLTHAVAEGDVTLTLRNDIDVTQVETNGAVVSQFLGGESDEKRVTIKEWNERREKSNDGSLTIISGKNVTTEKRK